MYTLYYQIWRFFFVFLFRLLYRFKAINRQYIPEEGPVLVCANHISLLDPPLVGMQTTREVHFMAKKELFNIPIVASLIRSLHAFPVDRGGQDKTAMRRSLTILKEGRVLLMFPEGTRLKTGDIHQVGKGHSGAGFIALKQTCTVIPAAVIGPYRLFRRTFVVFGEAVELDDLRGQPLNREVAQEASNRIVNAIQELIDQHLHRK